MTSLGRCTKPRSNSGRMGPSRCTAGKWGLQPLPNEQVPVLLEWLAPLLGALQSVPGAGRTCNGPSCSLCSAGVGRTGVFITLSIVLERMRYEGVVDMFQMVKTLRTQRPAMVQTEVSSPPVHGSGDLWEKRGGLMALGVGTLQPTVLVSALLTFPSLLPCRTSTSCATELHWSTLAASTTMQRNSAFLQSRWGCLGVETGPSEPEPPIPQSFCTGGGTAQAADLHANQF